MSDPLFVYFREIGLGSTPLWYSTVSGMHDKLKHLVSCEKYISFQSISQIDTTDPAMQNAVAVALAESHDEERKVTLI